MAQKLKNPNLPKPARKKRQWTVVLVADDGLVRRLDGGRLIRIGALAGAGLLALFLLTLIGVYRIGASENATLSAAVTDYRRQLIALGVDAAALEYPKAIATSEKAGGSAAGTSEKAGGSAARSTGTAASAPAPGAGAAPAPGGTMPSGGMTGMSAGDQAAESARADGAPARKNADGADRPADADTLAGGTKDSGTKDSAAAGQTAASGFAHPSAGPSAAAEGPAPVELADIRVDRGELSGAVTISFKVTNVGPEDFRAEGHSVVIFHPRKGDPGGPAPVPSVPLDNSGRPTGREMGKSFSISNYKKLSFRAGADLRPLRFQRATILVFNMRGQLWLEWEVDLSASGEARPS